MPNRLYLFLDEGGNFDFSQSGTCFYTFTCVAMEREFNVCHDLSKYKYDAIEYGLNLDSFHCAYDNAHVRGRVFGIIQDHIDSLKIDSVVVRKCKTGTSLQDPPKFYALMLGYLIKYVLERYDLSQIEEIIVITDRLPVKRNKEAFEGAIKTKLASMLPNGATYRVLHHNSGSHYGLQVADYCNWAILRKWETGDNTHHQTINPAIRSEFDIFRTGTTRYYEDERPL